MRNTCPKKLGWSLIIWLTLHEGTLHDQKRVARVSLCKVSRMHAVLEHLSEGLYTGTIHKGTLHNQTHLARVSFMAPLDSACAMQSWHPEI